VTTSASAQNQDPSLYCAYFGGPFDGLQTGDLPAVLSGEKLTGMVSSIPLAQPAALSPVAVYVCTSETQINGFWRFDYQGMKGPEYESVTARVGTDSAG
jgi:hypothetical protein